MYNPSLPEKRDAQNIKARDTIEDHIHDGKAGAVKKELEPIVLRMHSSGMLYDQAVKEFKRAYIHHILEECRGNQCKASRTLQMHRNTLSRTLYELGISAGDVRAVARVAKRPPRSVKAAPMEKRAAR